MTLFLSPHNDDAVLFGFYTLLRERPQVVVVFDSYLQAKRFPDVTAERRREEDRRALEIAALEPMFLGVPDDLSVIDSNLIIGSLGRVIEGEKIIRAKLETISDSINAGLFMRGLIAVEEQSPIERVFAPLPEAGGHQQHDSVGLVALELWGRNRVTFYTTYTRPHGRTRGEREVRPDHGHWIALKHRALACYESQMEHPELGCQSWFEGDLKEYYA